MLSSKILRVAIKFDDIRIAFNRVFKDTRKTITDIDPITITERTPPSRELFEIYILVHPFLHVPCRSKCPLIHIRQRLIYLRKISQHPF